MIDTTPAMIMMLNNDDHTTGTSRRSNKQEPSSHHDQVAVGGSSLLMPSCCYNETPEVQSMNFGWSPLSLFTPEDHHANQEVDHPISVSQILPSTSGSSSWYKEESSLAVAPHDHLDRYRDSTQHVVLQMVIESMEDNDDDSTICPQILIDYGVNELVRRRSSLLLSSSSRSRSRDNQRQQSHHFSFDLRELEPTPIGPSAKVVAPVLPTVGSSFFVDSCCKSSSLLGVPLSRKQTSSSSSSCSSSIIPGGGGVLTEDELVTSRCKNDQSPEQSFRHNVSLLPGGAGPAFITFEAATSKPPSTNSTRRSNSGGGTSAWFHQSGTKDNRHRHNDGGGRRFRDYEADLWSERFAELLQFKEVHGHCLVPHIYPLNPLLSQWVKRQRYQFKLKGIGRHSTLTDDRHQKLEAVGFVWHCHHASWYEKLDALREYKAQNGDCRVPARYHDKSLAVWVKCQRRQRKLFREGQPCSISKHRIDLLDKMGFEWNPRGL